jgi:hypothetical protein
MYSCETLLTKMKDVVPSTFQQQVINIADERPENGPTRCHATTH